MTSPSTSRPSGPFTACTAMSPAEGSASLAAIRELFFLDGEYRRGLHFDIPDNADGPDPVRKLDIVAAGLDAGDPQPLVVVNGSVTIVLALVGTPGVLSRWRHLQTGDRVQGEIPEPHASAILSRGRRYGQGEQNDGEPQTAHWRNLPRSPVECSDAGEAAPHSRSTRSVFLALSKFLAASSPIGATSLADARSAAAKSAPATVAPVRLAPPNAAPLSEALVRSAFRSDANSRSTRERSASRRMLRSRLADLSTARIRPMD